MTVEATTAPATAPVSDTQILAATASKEPAYVPPPAKDPAETMRALAAKMNPAPADAVEPAPAAAVEQPKTTPVVRAELAKARKALERDGLPSSLIDSWTPEQIEEIGLKRAKVQSDSDNVYRELSELKKSKESAAKEPDPKISAGNPVEIDKAFEPIVNTLGEDAAVAFRQLIETHGKQTYERALEAFRQEQAQREQALRQVAEARQNLASKYEWLKDDVEFGKLYAHAQTRDASKFESLEALFDDAARALYVDKLTELATSKAMEAVKQERSRSFGQPLDGTANRESRALHPEERAVKAMTLLSQGLTPEEVKQRLGR